MTELATDRDALAAALGASVNEEEEQLASQAEERLELERRRRMLSPEALAGDDAALAELDQVETRLAELHRQERLRELAQTEQAERARQAAEAGVERQRQRWTREKVDVETKRDAALLRIEKALGVLAALIPTAIRLDAEAETLGKKIDPGYHQGRVRRAIENRLSRQLREVGILDLPPVRNVDGNEPLAIARSSRRGRRA